MDETSRPDNSLIELLDIPPFQNLLESFTRLTGIPSALLDLSGTILIASKWQKLCTDFHRKNPMTASRCLESDTVLAGKLAKGQKYNVYKCKNGLIDVAVPILIDEVHMGNLFAGQFLFEPPDLDFFSKQAETYGFDKASYLEAVSSLPVISAEKIKETMNFLTDLTAIIAHSGRDKKDLLELNSELELRVEKRTSDLKKEIQSHRQTGIQLQRRIKFENLASRISSDLAGSDDNSIDPIINRALAAIGNFTGADRAYVFKFKDNSEQVDNTHEWCAEGIDPQIESLKNITLDDELPWFTAKIRNRETFHIPDVEGLPAEARLEQEHFKSQAIQSLIVVPMETGAELKGFLGFDAVRKRRAWAETDQNILRFIGDTICVALERNRAVKALRKSEARWQFALEGAGDGIWDWNPVTDRVYYSSRWKALLGYEDGDIGDTLDEWDSRLHPDDRSVVYEAIERHHRGETPVYVSEHRLRCKDSAYKWFLVRGKLFERTENGDPLRVIGTHTDISVSKQLEEEREQLITELKEALAKVKQLSGMLPICSYCKKIRDDKGYWKQIESYIRDHSEADFSHSICQECAKKYYPGFYK